MTFIARPAIAALVVALVGAVAGCGGGGGSSSSDEPLTRAQFASQADTMCRKADRERESALEAYLLKLNLKPGKQQTLQQQEYRVQKVVLPHIESAVDEVKELTPPKGEEEKVNALVEALETAIEKDIALSEELHPSGTAIEDPFAKAAAMARAYGFKACFVAY